MGIFSGLFRSRDKPKDSYDYVIGSVHYAEKDGKYTVVDWKREYLLQGVDEHFGGDIYALCENYYNAVGGIVEKTNCDIIGHFDLITKYNEGGRLFDESDPRYIAAWKKAADRLLASGAVFEINTGAISRGWRTSPYPSPEILAYLKARGARFVLSSDSHSAANIAFQFDQFASLAADRLVQFPLVK